MTFSQPRYIPFHQQRPTGCDICGEPFECNHYPVQEEPMDTREWNAEADDTDVMQQPITCQACAESFPLADMEEHVIGNFLGFFYLCQACERLLAAERIDPWGADQ